MENNYETFLLKIKLICRILVIILFTSIQTHTFILLYLHFIARKGVTSARPAPPFPSTTPYP